MIIPHAVLRTSTDENCLFELCGVCPDEDSAREAARNMARAALPPPKDLQGLEIINPQNIFMIILEMHIQLIVVPLSQLKILPSQVVGKTPEASCQFLKDIIFHLPH